MTISTKRHLSSALAFIALLTGTAMTLGGNAEALAKDRDYCGSGGKAVQSAAGACLKEELNKKNQRESLFSHDASLGSSLSAVTSANSTSNTRGQTLSAPKTDNSKAMNIQTLIDRALQGDKKALAELDEMNIELPSKKSRRTVLGEHSDPTKLPTNSDMRKAKGVSTGATMHPNSQQSIANSRSNQLPQTPGTEDTPPIIPEMPAPNPSHTTGISTTNSSTVPVTPSPLQPGNSTSTSTTTGIPVPSMPSSPNSTTNQFPPQNPTSTPSAPSSPGGSNPTVDLPTGGPVAGPGAPVKDGNRGGEDGAAINKESQRVDRPASPEAADIN